MRCLEALSCAQGPMVQSTVLRGHAHRAFSAALGSAVSCPAAAARGLRLAGEQLIIVMSELVPGHQHDDATLCQAMTAGCIAAAVGPVDSEDPIPSLLAVRVTTTLPARRRSGAGTRRDGSTECSGLVPATATGPWASPMAPDSEKSTVTY
jgi:hypothetical protein